MPTAHPPNADYLTTDYATPILPGEGDTDYARYMRTGALLSLQRSPAEMVHRDELMFQTVHQSTELWLKHACFEVEEAAGRLADGHLEGAIRLLARASLALDLLTGQLEMLRHLSPWDFQQIRTVLGHGSGFESPGWRRVQVVSEQLAAAFADLRREQHVELAEVFRGSPESLLFRLCEALLEWDERIALWRVRHYKVATRIIGHGVVGTKGTPVDVLTRLISQKFFPEVWEARTELTLTGPLGDAVAAGAFR